MMRLAVDVRIINPFMVGIKHVFTTMLATDLLFSKPRLKLNDEARADVAAIIGFSGQAVGNVALCFPLPTAVMAASQLAGEKLDQKHPDFADALGELANMVAGQAKSKFEGITASISLPRVVLGNELQLLDTRDAPVLLLPCDSPLGRFNTEVAMTLK